MCFAVITIINTIRSKMPFRRFRLKKVYRKKRAASFKCPLLNVSVIRRGFNILIYLLFYFLIATVIHKYHVGQDNSIWFVSNCTASPKETQWKERECNTQSVCTKPISIYLNLCRRVEDIFKTENSFLNNFFSLSCIGTRIIYAYKKM